MYVDITGNAYLPSSIEGKIAQDYKDFIIKNFKTKGMIMEAKEATNVNTQSYSYERVVESTIITLPYSCLDESMMKQMCKDITPVTAGIGISLIPLKSRLDANVIVKDNASILTLQRGSTCLIPLEDDNSEVNIYYVPTADFVEDGEFGDSVEFEIISVRKTLMPCES